MHLLGSEFHGEKLIKKAKCCRGTSTIPSHPWFHMVHLIVNLVNNIIKSFNTIKLFKVIRGKNVHTKNLLQKLINWLNWYLHRTNLSLNTPLRYSDPKNTKKLLSERNLVRSKPCTQNKNNKKI